MRLCFNGFCLGSQRPLAVEQSSQTTLTFSTAIDTLNITTFFDKTSSSSAENALLAEKKSFNKIETNSSLDKVFEKFEMINPDDSNYNHIPNNPIMFSHNDNNSINILPSQYSSDSQNNNLMNSSSQIELVKNDSVDILNNTVENIYINESLDINMDELDSEQHLTCKEKELMKVIQIKDSKIQELNEMLVKKEDEIANLKSHLDKFQSVFSGFAMVRKIGRNIQQRQRIGISAEPQSESSMRDLLNVSFPKYDKEDT